MKYFVVWPDGQRFGPADVSTLRLWAAEKRIGPSTVLMEEGSGRQLPATSLPDLQGLLFDPANPQSQAQGYYPRQGYFPAYGASSSRGSAEVALAWIFGALGLVCCTVFSVAGIALAVVAKGKGQKSATAALVFCCVTLVFGFLVGAIFNLFGTFHL